MPRYSYECTECENTNSYFHGFDETPIECIVCESTGSLVRVYAKSAFVVPNKNQTNNNQVVGTLTKEYIEENKRILKQQKIELKEEEYE